MRKTICTLALLGGTLFASAPSAAADPAPDAVAEPVETVTCVEEDPCWDCATMGNFICGPDQPTDIGTALTIERTDDPTETEVVVTHQVLELPRTGMNEEVALIGVTLIVLGYILLNRQARHTEQ